MSLTAAASGFLVFLLSLTVVQGQNDSGVTYASTQICALKGSTVEMSCTYTQPSRRPFFVPKVVKTLWFTQVNHDHEPVDLKTDSEYSGRVQYSSNNNDCTLRISDLRESDSAEYKFSFTTNQPGGRFTGSPGVTLSVTDLQVQVSTEGDWRELTCDHSCSPAAPPSIMWFKNGQKIHENALIYYPNIDPADSFSCAVKGYEAFSSPSLHAPTVPSVSVSPSEIVEGSSVNLTCSSDANPAASYTWYKKNGNPGLSQRKQTQQVKTKLQKLVFSPIQSSDSGEYFCTAKNSLKEAKSQPVSINVKFPPRLPSVSVSPSEIVEGSSVTLTCSSDANPAASYTWYKENEDSPKASGQIFTITDFRAEHSGNYYCEAQNSRGRRNSTLHLTAAGNSLAIMNIIRLSVVVLMPIPLLLLTLLMRKKKTLSCTTEPHDPVEIEFDFCPAYESISDTAAQTEDSEEQEELV